MKSQRNVEQSSTRIRLEEIDMLPSESQVPNQQDEFSGFPLWKRVLDVSLVMIVFPALLPLIVAVSLFIRFSSCGPIFFRQERVGLRGRKFVIYKFRTMTVGADTSVHEQYVAQLVKSNAPMTKLDAHGDTRLIPLGRLLRASGADELPQLLNVLRGDMSLVGPRPCVYAEFERYLPWQRERFNTLPGITGLWQVSGKNRMTFAEMIDCDIRYVRTRSFLLDLAILMKTIPAVVSEIRNSRRSATSPKHEQSGESGPDGRK